LGTIAGHEQAFGLRLNFLVRYPGVASLRFANPRLLTSTPSA
jgi:hypothetical protein